MFRSVLATAAVLLLAELAHYRASYRDLGDRPGPGNALAVVVLGFGNRGTRANLINRHRVRAGLRSIPADGSEVTLVVSGGAVRSPVPEARMLAEEARGRHRYAGAIVREETSRSTWQNIQNVIPLIEHADRIVIASNGLHAQKARRYLRRLRPDLAERLIRGEEYRFGELILLKPVLAVFGIRNLTRTGRPPAQSRSAPSATTRPEPLS